MCSKYAQRRHVLVTVVCSANNWVITDSCPQTASRETDYDIDGEREDRSDTFG
jgi:hypothetical protein